VNGMNGAVNSAGNGVNSAVNSAGNGVNSAVNSAGNGVNSAGEVGHTGWSSGGWGRGKCAGGVLEVSEARRVLGRAGRACHAVKP